MAALGPGKRSLLSQELLANFLPLLGSDPELPGALQTRKNSGPLPDGHLRAEVLGIEVDLDGLCPVHQRDLFRIEKCLGPLKDLTGSYVTT